MFVALAALATALPQDLTSYTSDQIRVQVLSPNLIRIEKKGPKGFENRETFHVVGRKGWPGAKGYILKSSGITARGEHIGGAILVGERWRVEVPSNAENINDVRVTSADGKTELFKFKGELTNNAWLPAPGKMPKVWSIADSPRIIPSEVGASPDPKGRPDSGWDLGNDAPDVYVFLPNGNYDTLRRDFLKLTGPIEMPPLYALGYVDSRYYAYEQNEALARIDEYRRRKFPLDTFVVDTDWRKGGSHGYEVDPKYFPDMPGFLKAAHQKHVRIMFNDHPEPRGKSAFDPVEMAARFNGLAPLLKMGVDIWWYDRNWNVGIPSPAPHLARETWGMRLYRDITARVRPNERPLMMANVDGIDNGHRNRPPNIAAHRFPVQWTGDTLGQWIFLRRGVENAVFSGAQALNAWVNEDLGGHAGRPETDLYIRFLQFGSVSPFMRVHCTKGDTREPWSFGPLADKISLDYTKMRYRLMPLLYASAREAYETGEPMVRRLDLDYPQYANAARDDQFLVGDSLLVAPIVGGVEGTIVPKSAFPNGLEGEYFDNKDLKGAPSLSPVTDLNFDWRQGSPMNLPVDNFSVRWVGKIRAPKDRNYRLSVTADDGVRMWIDGKLVVDKWVPQDSVTTEASTDLQAGTIHDLKVEYMELSSNAAIKLRWRPVLNRDAGSERDVWIPPGTWTNVWTGERLSGPVMKKAHAPIEQMPMYVRDGAILPLGPDVQWTGEKDWSDLTLNVYPGNGKATVYEDDGHSLGYSKGEFRKTPITMISRGGVTRITIGAAKGRYPGALGSRSWKLRFVGRSIGVPPMSVRVDGRKVTARLVAKSLQQPFRNSGGEPTGAVYEVAIPKGSVSRAHVVEVR